VNAIATPAVSEAPAQANTSPASSAPRQLVYLMQDIAYVCRMADQLCFYADSAHDDPEAAEATLHALREALNHAGALADYGARKFGGNAMRDPEDWLMSPETRRLGGH
jgi:hypothetical protein